MPKTLRPFQETIVDAIHRCRSDSSAGEVLTLFQLITETEIPEGHDEIIAAIEQYFKDSIREDTDYVRRVKEGLEAQKQMAAEKHETETKEAILGDIRAFNGRTAPTDESSFYG